MSKREFELQIYSDVACPWCYIGWKRLRQTMESDKMKEYKFTLKPKFMPYLINDNLDEKPVSKGELYDSKFLGGDNASAVRNKINREGETVGIQFSWDKNAKVRQTKRAHRVLEKAYEDGGFDLQSRLAEKLYAAFNEHSIDVGDADELAKIASSEPDFLSFEDAKKFIEGDDGEYELDKALQKARHWGIDSVPTYILDEQDQFTEAVKPEQWFTTFDVLSRAYGL